MKVTYLLIMTLVLFSSQKLQWDENGWKNNPDEKKIWKYFYNKTGNKYAAAGMMGNLYDECRFRSIDLENASEKEDQKFTDKVNRNGGDLSVLLSTDYGYGLGQWTHPDRKKRFFNFAKDYFQEKGKTFNIGDVDMQLRFIWYELKTRSTNKSLKTKQRWSEATSIYDATKIIFKEYEIPADLSSQHLDERVSFAQKAYENYKAGRYS